MNVTPELGLPAYTCPHCRALAQQSWSKVATQRLSLTPQTVFDSLRDNATQFAAQPIGLRAALPSGSLLQNVIDVTTLQIGRCTACNLATIWLCGTMLFPQRNDAPPPSPDLPEAAKADYEEAALVLPHSPKAAAALLRLALEKMCVSLLNRKGSINELIGDFVALGVPPQVQSAMDILRVTGNNAVHAGKMDNIDDQATAVALFGLLNLITDVLITQPKHVAEMYAGLPEGAKAAIEKRDRKPAPEA